MLPQLILSLLLHIVWDIPMVVVTSQVQHLVVLILIMVVIDLDVTEVAAEYNVTATDVEVTVAEFTFTICRTCSLVKVRGS